MRICPAHLLATIPIDRLPSVPFARAPIGTGRFRFEGWHPGVSLELVADTDNYRGSAIPNRLVFLFSADPHSSLLSLLSGEADVYDALRPENIPDLKSRPSLIARSYANPSYAFLQFNTRDGEKSAPHPIFGEPAVRRALEMALDRKALAVAVFDSMATVPHGPFSRSSAYADTTIEPVSYDPDGARRILDSLGWRLAPDGVRIRRGHRMTFSIAVPASSQSRLRYAVLLQEAFRGVGADVRVATIDMRAFSAELQSHRFDAALQVIHIDPSPRSLRYGWTTAAATDGFNYGRFSDPRFDILLDSALDTAHPSMFHRAYQLLEADAPAIWLYEEQPILVFDRRWHPAAFGANGWWTNLADWRLEDAAKTQSGRTMSN